MSESGEKSGRLLVTVWGNSTQGSTRDDEFPGALREVQNTKIFTLSMFQERTSLRKEFHTITTERYGEDKKIFYLLRISQW